MGSDLRPEGGEEILSLLELRAFLILVRLLYYTDMMTIHRLASSIKTET